MCLPLTCIKLLDIEADVIRQETVQIQIFKIPLTSWGRKLAVQFPGFRINRPENAESLSMYLSLIRKMVYFELGH